MVAAYPTLEFILAGLMRRYKQRVPDVDKILQAMVVQGMLPSVNAVENDHIAFRTLGVPLLGIQSLERVFLTHGYVKRDHYKFTEKKLDAYWYAPPDPKFPRIFISELRVEQLSTPAQGIIHKYTRQVAADPTTTIDLSDGVAVDAFLHSPLWSAPTYTEYQTLLAESEYAGWVIYNRYYLNHFTISVHSLPEPYNTVENFNKFLESIGIKLNNAGGTVKTSPDKALIQSSTVAEMVPAMFSSVSGSGTEQHLIAGSYVEFAERKVLPEFSHLPPNHIRREHRRDGFEAKNADKIFESTYSSQVHRNRTSDLVD